MYGHKTCVCAVCVCVCVRARENTFSTIVGSLRETVIGRPDCLILIFSFLPKNIHDPKSTLTPEMHIFCKGVA